MVNRPVVLGKGEHSFPSPRASGVPVVHQMRFFEDLPETCLSPGSEAVSFWTAAAIRELLVELGRFLARWDFPILSLVPAVVITFS